MTTTSLQGVSWRDVPHHPVKRAGAILGVSGSQVYKFVHEGRLHVVKSAGKTQITTESMLALQANAKPWTPDAARLAKANAARIKAHRAIV
jgi:hypothetical protein